MSLADVTTVTRMALSGGTGISCRNTSSISVVVCTTRLADDCPSGLLRVLAFGEPREYYKPMEMSDIGISFTRIRKVQGLRFETFTGPECGKGARVNGKLSGLSGD